MRTAFLNVLMEEMEKNQNIMVLVGDLGYSVFEKFKEKYPNNFLNMGISEQNMVGVAAGLAITGKKVFIYSIVPFVTFRCLEQIRNDLCYQDLDVTIVGIGSGLSYGSLGFSHHAIEDVGALKAIPNITILSPADSIETKCLVKDLFAYKHPVYLRLGKSKEKDVNDPFLKLKIGQINEIKKGTEIALVTYGNIIEEVYEVYKRLVERGYRPSLVTVPTVKPINVEEIRRIYEKHNKIIVIEEHNELGGLAESITPMNCKKDVSFYSFAIKDHFVKGSGSNKYLRKKVGLDAETLYTKILDILKT